MNAGPVALATAGSSLAVNLAEVLDQLYVGVLLTDSSRNISRVNQAAESMIGTGAGQLIGNPLDAIPALIDRDDSARRCLETGQPITERSVDVGDTAIDVHFSPMDDGLIIELLPLQRRLVEEVSQGRQLQALTELLRGLAHEIKNPLGGLRGAAQLLERRIDNPVLAEYTQVIIAEADRLAALVDRFQRPESRIRVEALNPHEVLEHVGALISAAHGDEVVLERDYDPSIPAIDCDRDRLVQVLLNLVQNAVEAGAGRVILKTRIRRQIAIGTLTHRSAVSMEVCDDAGGVAEELKELLFYPLISGRPNGNGLGLAIAQRIAAELGGIIRFHDRPGGSTFTLLLPLVAVT